MDIKETTPPPQQRTFRLDVTETELYEIRTALNHMLELSPQWYSPQWYTNTQHNKVKVMRDKINQMLGVW